MMLSGKITQAQFALSERGTASTTNHLIGPLMEKRELLHRRLPQKPVFLDAAIDPADDYPSNKGFFAMMSASLLGLLLLVALYRVF